MLKPAAQEFEQMLTGGHPNSLGLTEDVVDRVLADRSRLDDLYQCYFSTDDVVRLRVASAMKRVAIARPDWVIEIADDLQAELAANDQASIQWTLALIFDELADRMSPAQHAKAVEIMLGNLSQHDDWIVLNNSMKVLTKWAKDDPALAYKLKPYAKRLTNDKRNSVAQNAAKLLDQLSAGS
jgi:hypothetical protein